MGPLSPLEGVAEAAALLLLGHLPAEQPDEEDDHEDGRRLQDELGAARHGRAQSSEGLGADDEDRRPDAHALEEPFGVRDAHADAAVRGGVADRGGVRGAVNADAAGAQSPSSACRAGCSGPAGSARRPPPSRAWADTTKDCAPLTRMREAAERRRVRGHPGCHRERRDGVHEARSGAAVQVRASSTRGGSRSPGRSARP